MSDIARLIEIVEPEATALGFALVRVALLGGEGDRTLQVMAERAETRQLNIDDCAALSRRISEKLDALELAGNDPIDGAYRLEVSSPGIDRPLTRLSDFADWKGHEAKVQFKEPVEGRKSLNGVLDGVDLGTIAFTDRKSGALRFAFDNVASAKLVLTDRLIAATRPLDTTGVDEHDLEESELEDPRLASSEPETPDIGAEYLSTEQDQ